MKAWGHGGLCHILLQELKGQTGQIMADEVMCCFPSPCPPAPMCQYSPWGLFPQKNSVASPLWLLWSPRQQASSGLGGSAVSSTPCPSSWVTREGRGPHLRLGRRKNKCCLQEEKPEIISLILKAGEAFLASQFFCDNRKHKPEGGRRKETSPLWDYIG